MKLQPFQVGEWVSDLYTPAVPREVLEVRPWPQSPSGWVARTREHRPGMDRIDWIDTSRLTRTKAPAGSPPGGGDFTPAA